MCSTLVRAVLPAVLAGGILAAPVLPARAQFDRRDLATSQSNLKQLGIAFHNAESTLGYFPGDIADKDGKPLLSWRVAVLPYIEQENLYKQFKLDEPWDSEDNKKLVEKMPKVYAPVRGQAKAGETFYQVFKGEKAPFGEKVKNPKIASFSDGLSNTGLVFEAGDPVVWTKPADLTYDEKKALPKLGGLFDGESNVLLGDGTVRRLKKGADEKELRKLIMPADGEVIDLDKLSP